MSVDRSPKTSVVYVKLLNEGVDVYRPVEAVPLGDDTAKLVAPLGAEYDPEDEDWEFKPGSVVKLSVRRLSDRETLVAVSLAG